MIQSQRLAIIGAGHGGATTAYALMLGHNCSPVDLAFGNNLLPNMRFVFGGHGEILR